MNDVRPNPKDRTMTTHTADVLMLYGETFPSRVLLGTSLRQSLEINTASDAVAYVTPLRLGGEGVRWALFRRIGVSSSAIVAALATEVVVDAAMIAAIMIALSLPLAHAEVDWAGRVIALTRTPAARAIGEIGLDYHYDFAPPDVQQRVFRAQVSLAYDLDLPVVIHTREADDDTVRILREEGGGRLRGVLHCFTGGPSLARAGLDLGFYISLSGIITFPKAAELRETVRAVPLDRVLIETDSPFLAPVPYRGKRNEPAHVARVAETLGELHGIAAEDVSRQAAANFHALFRP